MPIISKKTAGFILTIGFILILALNLIFIQPVLISFSLVIFLLLSVFFLYNPKWGFLLFLIIRPSIDEFSDNFSLTLAENISVNLSALLGVVFLVLAFIYLSRNKVKILKTPVSFFFLIFILISAISVFFSIDISGTFYEIVRLFTLFASFILAWAIIKKEKDKNTLLQIIIFSAIFPFAESIYQLLTGSGLGGTAGIESRLMGTFSHPNSFASFALIIFAASYYFFNNCEKKYRVFYIFSLAVSLFIIFETFSRGAWLGLIVFIFVIGIFKNPKIILGLAALLLILFASSETFRYRVQDVYNPPATSSVRWRFLQWGEMYDAYLKRPLTGYGAGTETLVHEKEYGFYAGNPYTHNDFLKAAVETGFFGFLSYTFLIFSTAIFIFIKYLKTKKSPEKNLLLIILALFLAEITFSLTSNIFRGTATQWTLWALVGTALAKQIKK